MRPILLTLGWFCVAVAATGTAAHLSGSTGDLAARLAAFTPVLVSVGLFAVVAFAVGRAWIALVVAVIVTAAGLGTQMPLYRGVSEEVSESDRAVMQANLRLGQADPTALVERVRSEHVDVLTVVELTDEAVAGLQRAGLGALLRHAYLRPRAGGAGAGIYSRYPLRNGTALGGLTLSNVRADVMEPDGRRWRVYALHPIPPYPEPAWRWGAELDRIAAVLSADEMPLVVGADINSTFDHRRFRTLLHDSGRAGAPQLVDAAEHLGAGIVATYPAGRRHPPLLALDRILTRGGPTPTSFRRVDLSGSDHHGVIATVRIG
ncbi:endonuclease/exonuclease/phosphatase family protein [Gordonia sp. CPCC 206044]|uniref:endonuclease/exonuclease/phosphatase family protein n=1 Tax=Gordonia sp. CPCC 206044 TaxID=3140793 RepID=UPI003AF3E8E2